MGTLRWGSETVPPRPVSVWPFRGSAPPAHWGVCLTPVPSGDTGRAAVQLLCRLWISLAPATPFLELIFAGRRGRDQALPEPGAAPLIPWRALSYCVPGGSLSSWSTEGFKHVSENRDVADGDIHTLQDTGRPSARAGRGLACASPSAFQSSPSEGRRLPPSLSPLCPSHRHPLAETSRRKGTREN